MERNVGEVELMPLYMLDTNVVLHLVRGKDLGKFLEEKYHLIEEEIRPLICVVSCGEIWSLAKQKNWGEEKKKALRRILECLTVADINHPEIIEAYVEIEMVSQKHSDGAKNMGKNDLWIAACAKVSRAVLLTTDKDFDHLHPQQIQRIWIDPTLKKNP